MQNKLITFGCSHTEGYYFIDGMGDIPSYTQYYNYHNGVFPPKWPDILAEKLGLECINLGQGGAGNDSINRIFNLNLDLIQKDDIVIYQIGQAIRIPFAQEGRIGDLLVGVSKEHWPSEDIGYEDARTFFINRDRPEWVTITLRSYILNVLNTVKLKGAKVWFWADDTKIVSTMFEHPFILREAINPIRYMIEPGKALLSMIHGAHNDATIAQETNGKINDLHMGGNGHRYQAQYMYDFIQKTKDLH